jgi:hypothetical protein
MTNNTLPAKETPVSTNPLADKAKILEGVVDTPYITNRRKDVGVFLHTARGTGGDVWIIEHGHLPHAQRFAAYFPEEVKVKK